MHAPEDRKQIDRVVDAIASDELATVDRDTLTAVVEADFHRYSARARFTDFVPVLVERDVRARLRKHRARTRRRPVACSRPSAGEHSARRTGEPSVNGRRPPTASPPGSVTLPPTPMPTNPSRSRDRWRCCDRGARAGPLCCAWGTSSGTPDAAGRPVRAGVERGSS